MASITLFARIIGRPFDPLVDFFMELVALVYSNGESYELAQFDRDEGIMWVLPRGDLPDRNEGAEEAYMKAIPASYGCFFSGLALGIAVLGPEVWGPIGGLGVGCLACGCVRSIDRYELRQMEVTE